MENVMMEDNVCFVLKPTLQQVAMAKIATDMWMQDKMLALMPKINLYYPKVDDEMEVVIKMRENVRNLPLPEQLKDELSAFIKPVGTQFVRWLQYIRHQFHLERINPKELCWTPQGTIDQKKSALVLVRDQRLDVAMRYRLACTFCFPDQIVDLMNDLPRESILDFNVGGLWRRELVIFWAFHLREEMVELKAIIERNQDPHVTPGLKAFRSTAVSLNSVAAKYLFENILNPAEKKTLTRYTLSALGRFSVFRGCHFDFIPNEIFTEYLCFLLSRMDRDQQMEIFERLPTTVLQCLLVWPYQCFFVETAKRMWRFIKENGFNSVLFQIYSKIDHSCKVCVYRDLFCQFWELSSVEFRKYVIGDCSFTKNFYKILEDEEKHICRMILAEADAAEKENLVWGDPYDAIPFYRKIIKNEKWNMLKFFLKQCAPSDEKIVRAKKLMINSRHSQVNEKQTREFVQILDSFISDQQLFKETDSLKDDI